MEKEDLDAHREILGTYVETMKEVNSMSGALPPGLEEDLRDCESEVEVSAEAVEESLSRDDPVRDSKLAVRGLAGKQLGLKRRAVARSRFAWIKGNRTKGPLLRRLLRWLNLYLGSLASVVGGAELLKECKEAAEIGLDEADGRYDA